jgi:hypothetical protein
MKMNIIALVVTATLSSSVYAAPPVVSDSSYGQPQVAEADLTDTVGMTYVGANARLTTIVTGFMGGNSVDAKALLVADSVTGNKLFGDRIDQKIGNSFSNLEAMAVRVAKLESENASLRSQSSANSDALGLHREIDGKWGKPYTAANVLTAYQDTAHPVKAKAEKNTSHFWFN